VSKCKQVYFLPISLISCWFGYYRCSTFNYVRIVLGVCGYLF